MLRDLKRINYDKLAVLQQDLADRKLNIAYEYYTNDTDQFWGIDELNTKLILKSGGGGGVGSETTVYSSSATLDVVDSGTAPNHTYDVNVSQWLMDKISENLVKEIKHLQDGNFEVIYRDGTTEIIDTTHTDRTISPNQPSGVPGNGQQQWYWIQVDDTQDPQPVLGYWYWDVASQQWQALATTPVMVPGQNGKDGRDAGILEYARFALDGTQAIGQGSQNLTSVKVLEAAHTTATGLTPTISLENNGTMVKIDNQTGYNLSYELSITYAYQVDNEVNPFTMRAKFMENTGFCDLTGNYYRVNFGQERIQYVRRIERNNNQGINIDVLKAYVHAYNGNSTGAKITFLEADIYVRAFDGYVNGPTPSGSVVLNYNGVSADLTEIEVDDQ